MSVARSDETSTTTQSERIADYSASQGLELVKTIVVSGKSAWKTSALTRPDVVEALRLIDAGVADVLVVWRIDRVARNARDLLNLIHEIEARGGSFASVQEQFDTTGPTGKLLVTILGAIAEMESAIKSERVQVWQDQRLEHLATPTGPRPYGYRRERNRLIIDPKEAAVIRQAAAAVIDGDGLRTIVARFKAKGVTKDGRPISRRGLAAILTGPTIAALKADGDSFVPSPAWKPILDRERWELVRSILSDPARRKGPGNGRRWLLSGLLVCGRPDPDRPGEVCGTPMGIKPNRWGPRYTCYDCGVSIGAADTDVLIEGVILRRLDLAAWRRLKRHGVPVDTSALEDELHRLAEQRRDGYVDETEWKTLKDGIMDKLRAATSDPLALPRVDDPRKEWPELGLEAKRLIVSAVVARAVVLPARPGLSYFDPDRVLIEPRRL